MNSPERANPAEHAEHAEHADLAALTAIGDPGWAVALEPVAGTLRTMADFLRAEVDAGHGFLPAAPNVLRAFNAPFGDVRVLIVGQDPYPTPGHPIGLSFAVDPAVRPLPRSLQNIYRELGSDLGIPTPTHGDLTAWTENGVLLLNRVLTVRPGVAGSHRGKGWEAVTEGLGLVDLAVDVHAAQWGTLGRLIASTEAGLVGGGVAIDEDTVLIVGDGTLHVEGLGSVWRVTSADNGVLVSTLGA